MDASCCGWLLSQMAAEQLLARADNTSKNPIHVARHGVFRVRFARLWSRGDQVEDRRVGGDAVVGC